MLDRALVQMLSDVYWGDLDVLLLDLPPGTGDVAISLGQHLPNAEVVVVTTPQEAAAEVAERAGTMASMMHQRVVGVVENMSFLALPALRPRAPARGLRLRRRRPGGGDALRAVRLRRPGARRDPARPRRCARAATPASRSSTPTRPRRPPSSSPSVAEGLSGRGRGLAGHAARPDPRRHVLTHVRDRAAGDGGDRRRRRARLRSRPAARPGPAGRPVPQADAEDAPTPRATTSAASSARSTPTSSCATSTPGRSCASTSSRRWTTTTSEEPPRAGPAAARRRRGPAVRRRRDLRS